MKFNLRNKLLFFSIIIALIPLAIAGNTMITITQDELKSSANDELSTTGEQLARELDNMYINIWRAPLLLVRNSIDNENLGVAEKISILTGIRNIADIVALQLTVDGIAKPVVVLQDEFAERLAELSIDPTDMLKLPNEKVMKIAQSGEIHLEGLEYISEAKVWLITMVIPLNSKISGRTAVLTARINLDRIINRLQTHPFNKNGIISIINNEGKAILTADGSLDMSDIKVVQEAMKLMKADSRAIGVFPYVRPDGQKMLGAHAFPAYFDWGIVLEKSEDVAYLAIAKMIKSLMILMLVGLLASVGGAIVFANRISKPIIEIGTVAHMVGKGNFEVRVSELKSKDEISDLAKRINEMIVGLQERFHLQKFVSGQTIDAIRHADKEGVKLGGERRTATVFFSDIRGFTSFSEKNEPETVIKMLNVYLRAQAEIVRKHNGDIDKYVGDELVAVFQGDHMIINSILCAVEIQDVIEKLNIEHASENWNIDIGIGINTGDMIMGAMGSEERMDYTILGDNVNLGARLCSKAAARQIIISEFTFARLDNRDFFYIDELEPIMVKGKEKPVKIFEVRVPPRPWPQQPLNKGKA